MPTLYVIYGSDTPNEGRVKINWNFANLLAGSITGITASVFTNPNPTTKTVGGIPAGTTFVGDYYIQDLFDMLLYPSVTPIFTSFGISAQSTSLEVGESVSGTKTFTWSINSATYLKPNSIDIEDTTNATTLASSLSNDGTENIAVSVSKTSPSSNIWTIYGEDTDDNVFSRQFRVDWYYRIFHGSNASGTINAAQIAALSSTLATNDINGTYSIGAANYGYICVPSSFDIPTAFRNSSTNMSIEMAGQDEGYSSYDGLFHYSAVTLTRNSVNIAYRLYRTKNTISSSTSVTIKNSGATTAHLYDQYYTGSTTLGNFLSNFTPGGGGTITGIIPGTNIQTGGTPTNVTISTVSNPSFNSLSASTYFCGTTSFDTIFSAFAPQGLDSVLTVSNSATTKDIFIKNIAGGSDHTIPDWNLFLNSNIIGGEFIDFSTSLGEYSMTYLAPSFGFIGGSNYSSLIQSSQISISSVSNSLFLGGTSNSAITTESSGILGGLSNQLLSTSGAFLIAGFNNTINGSNSLDPNFYEHALILGGKSNTITNGTSTLIAASSSSSILSNINEGFVNSSIIASDSSSIEYSVRSSIFDSFNTIIGSSIYSSIIGSLNSSISGRTATSIIAGNTITATENYSLYTSNLRAETAIFSAGTNLNNIFVHKVTAGTNIVTGGTAQNPNVSVSSTPSFTSVFATNLSGTTLFSGNTDVSRLFVSTASTFVRSISGGTNIVTGGTAQNPNVSVSSTPSFTSVFATNLSGTTLFSGSTPLETTINQIASSYSGSSSQLAVSSGNTSPYTIQLSDPFNLKVMSSSTAIDIIIPTNASVAIPVGSQIMFKQGGTGQLRFSASTGVTLHSYGNAYNHVGQFSTSFLTKESSNLWVIDGNLTTLNL